MQPGSLVVVKPLGCCVGVFSVIPFQPPVIIEWLPVDDEKHEYVIRGSDGEDGWSLEEGIIGMYNGAEITIKEKYLREIAPPQTIDIEAIIESSSPVELKTEELELEEF